MSKYGTKAFDTLLAYLWLIRYLFRGRDRYPISPFLIEDKMVRSDLAEIQHPKSVRGVVDGPWDKQKALFTDNPTPKAFKQRFEDGLEWPETTYPEWRVKGDSERYFEQYERLYQDIKENGFDDNYPIAVYIGREGDYILNHGFHRLSVSLVLKLEEVPVEIVARHAKWEEARRNLVDGDPSADSLEEFGEHPDVRFLRDSSD